MTDEPGYADDMEYFPGNETIRYVVAVNDGEPVSFGTMSFDAWGKRESAKAGLRPVREVTADRLDTDEFGSGIGRPPEFVSSDSLVIWLEAMTQTPNEETEQTPPDQLTRLADAAPRSVEATVSLEGDTFSRTVPVFAKQIDAGGGGAAGSIIELG